MNNNFLKILISVCSGTKIFKKIVNFSFLKAFWHLFLLAVICSFIFLLSQSFDMKRNINSTAAFFHKEFGNVILKQTGLYPQKKPNIPRSLNYNSIQVNYFPTLPKDNDLKIDSNLNNSGFVWLPNSIVGWLKLNNSKFFVYQALTSVDSHNLFGVFPEDKISSYLHNSTISDFQDLRFTFFVPMKTPLFGLTSLKQTNNFLNIKDITFYWSAFGLFMHFLFMIIFNALLYSLLFAAIYSFVGRASLYNLKFKSFLTIALYAGFPAIITGTLFSIADIQWLQYQTIYLIALVIYLIIVTRKLRNIENK